MNDWQYTNEYFAEGLEHYQTGGSINDCPYDYLDVDHENEKLVQLELYRQQEWYAGFQHGFQESLHKKKTA